VFPPELLDPESLILRELSVRVKRNRGRVEVALMDGLFALGRTILVGGDVEVRVAGVRQFDDDVLRL